MLREMEICSWSSYCPFVLGKYCLEIPDNVKENLAIHAVETIDEVLGLALENPPEGIEFVKVETKAKAPRRKAATKTARAVN